MLENLRQMEQSEKEAQPIRILYSIKLFPGTENYKEAGGAERTLQKLMNGLDGSYPVYDMTVVLGDNLKAGVREPVSGRIKLISKVGNMDFSAFMLQNQKDFDVLHLADGFWWPNQRMLLSVALWDKTKPVIARVTSEYYLYAFKKANPRLRNLLFSRINKFVAISPEISEGLAEMGIEEEKIAFIPNAVDTEKFLPASLERKMELRKSLYSDQVAQDKRIFISQGRIMENKKKKRTLIREWINSGLGLGGHMLVLAGPISETEGEFEKTYELIQEAKNHNVVWTGSLDPEIVAKYLQSADIFVLPSSTEGMSNALLEAMSCGLPALVREGVSGTGMVTQGYTGFKFGEDQDIRSALVRFADNFLDLDNMSRNARQLIVDDFAIGKMIERYDLLYRNLLVKN